MKSGDNTPSRWDPRSGVPTRPIIRTKERNGSWLVFGIISLAVILGAGCGTEKKPTAAPKDAPPTACFELHVGPGTFSFPCRYDSTYTLDASCSSDEETPLADLEVRWDFDNDTLWETDFTTLKTYSMLRPPEGEWTVRCQVRDSSGQTAVVSRMLGMWTYPHNPDVGLDAIVFDNGAHEYVTTITLGAMVTVQLVEHAIGDLEDYRTIISLDGQPWQDFREGFQSEGIGCGGPGFDWTPGAAGSYTFSATIDADDDYAETDETNNSASATLIVTP